MRARAREPVNTLRGNFPSLSVRGERASKAPTILLQQKVHRGIEVPSLCVCIYIEEEATVAASQFRSSEFQMGNFRPRVSYFRARVIRKSLALAQHPINYANLVTKTLNFPEASFYPASSSSQPSLDSNFVPQITRG